MIRRSKRADGANEFRILGGTPDAINDLQKTLDDAGANIAAQMAAFMRLSQEMENGGWARNKVASIAKSALAKLKAGSPAHQELTECLDNFRRNFAMVADDLEMTVATRRAVTRAIVQALFIGGASDGVGPFDDRGEGFLQELAKSARLIRSKKDSAKIAERRDAVRAAMKKSSAKPSTGEAYARLIQVPAEELIGPLSVWSIRRDVRAILKELPRK